MNSYSSASAVALKANTLLHMLVLYSQRVSMHSWSLSCSLFMARVAAVSDFTFILTTPVMASSLCCSLSIEYASPGSEANFKLSSAHVDVPILPHHVSSPSVAVVSTTLCGRGSTERLIRCNH